MYGFLYRDIRMARPMLIVTCVMLFYTIAAPIFAALNLISDLDASSYNFICMILILFRNK